MNTKILSLEKFLKLFEYAKMLKKKYIYISNYSIYGSDDDMCSLSVMDLSSIDSIVSDPEISGFFIPDNLNNYPEIFFNKNEIIALLKSNNFGYIQRTTANDSMIYDQSGYSYLWIGYSRMMKQIKDMINRVSMLIIQENTIYQIDDLRNNKEIMDTLSLKASEGMNMLNIHSNIITMYGGMYPITSKDKVSMRLIDCMDSSILSEVTIYKPKNITIQSYIRYRKLI